MSFIKDMILGKNKPEGGDELILTSLSDDVASDLDDLELSDEDLNSTLVEIQAKIRGAMQRDETDAPKAEDMDPVPDFAEMVAKKTDAPMSDVESPTPEAAPEVKPDEPAAMASADLTPSTKPKQPQTAPAPATEPQVAVKVEQPPQQVAQQTMTPGPEIAPAAAKPQAPQPAPAAMAPRAQQPVTKPVTESTAPEKSAAEAPKTEPPKPAPPHKRPDAPVLEIHYQPAPPRQTTQPPRQRVQTRPPQKAPTPQVAEQPVITRVEKPASVEQKIVEVPAPAAGRSGRRAGRVKTRLLGFEHSQNSQSDPFENAPKNVGNGQAKFPVGWIVIISGPGRGTSFPLFNGVSQIGRGEEQAICLDFGDNSISRINHAAIAYDKEKRTFFLGHGGKANLVRVNDRPVLSTEEMSNYDLIRIGETTLRFIGLCGTEFDWDADNQDQVDDAAIA